MPNRVIKESINESKGLSQCSVFAEDLYKRLITYADDNGRFNADTEIMLARLYPRELMCLTEQDIIDGLLELAGIGKISFYSTKYFNATSANTGGVYGCFPNWDEHQRVRDSKRKCPDPDDTEVNDWYLRRFISIDMRAQIVERDGFKCKICGKFVTTCKDAKRFVKLGSGMYHIDHIVPCTQGGRATQENLRLTCPECNAHRKRRFTFEEIVEFTKYCEKNGICRNSPQLAATRGLNPIQSESESESNPHPPRRRARRKADEDVVPVENVETVENFCKQNGINADARGFYQHYSALGWRDSKGKPIRNWRALLMKWADDHPATEHRTGITADDPTGTRGRSFDTGEFMQAALSRSYGKEA